MKVSNILIAASVCLITTVSAETTTTTGKPGKKKPAVAQKNNDTITTKSGLRYVITKKNPTGTQAKKGDKIEAHYTGTLTNGKKFDSSRDRNQTFGFVIGNQEVIAGWDEGFAYLKEGETATFIIPDSLGYGARDMGDIPPHSTLIFDVELVKIVKPYPYEPFSGKGKDTITLASGLKYIVIEPGDPAVKATTGQMASVHYAGYLMDGTMFDNSFQRLETISVEVGGGGVILGWQAMLPLMCKGMKVRVIIPAAMAYGAKGYPGVIPPNATLIFDMILMELK
ncbi:MAG: FKBP-type peptidyl-prolyl cis-trans isomerase [Bacteroidota bacterium]